MANAVSAGHDPITLTLKFTHVASFKQLVKHFGANHVKMIVGVFNSD